RKTFVLEQNGREDELHVGCGQSLRGSKERRRLGNVRGQRATAADDPAGEIAERLGAVERFHPLGRDENAGRQMVLQVSANVRELVNELDSNSRCGDPIAPAQRITSRRTCAACTVSARWKATP